MFIIDWAFLFLQKCWSMFKKY